MSDQSSKRFSKNLELDLLRQVATAIVAIDFDGRVILWNEGAEKLYKRSADEMVGKPLTFSHRYEYLNGETDEEVAAQVRAAGNWSGENLHILWHGQELIVESDVSLLRGDDGEAIGMIAVIRDVTLRRSKELEKLRAAKIAEQEARENWERLRRSSFFIETFLDHLPVPAYVKDESGTYIYHNRASQQVAKALGASYVGKTDGELFVHEVSDKFQSNDRTVLETGEPIRTIEPYWTQSDSTKRHFLTVKFPVADEHGKKYVGGVSIDLSENMRNRAELRVQSALLDFAQDAIFLVDPKGVITYWNSGAERLYGWSRPEAIGQTARELLRSVLPVSFDEVLRDFDRDGYWQGEITQHRKNGEPVPVLSRWSALRDADGAEIGRMAINIDLTERKLAEEQLSRSEERFRTSLESLHDAFGIASAIRNDNGDIVDFRVEYVNESACRLDHVAREQYVGKRLLELFPHMRENGTFDAHKKAVQSGEPQFLETIWINSPGNAAGKAARDIRITKLGDGVAVAWRDVTAEKIAEQQLKESRAEFRTLVDALPQIIWTSTPEGTTEYLNAFALDYYGLTADAARGFDWLSRVHPDDRSAMETAWAKAVRDGEPCELELRLRRNGDEQYRWHLSRAVPIINESGELKKWIGFDTDVHELQLAQQRAEESEQWLQLAMGSAGLGAWEYDLRTRQVRWSYNHFALFGMKPEQFDGTEATAFSNFHPEDRERITQDVQDSVRNRRNELDHEFRVVWPDGSVHWIRSKAKIHYDANGEAERVIGVNWDCTERKLAADIIAEREARLEQSEREARARADELAAILDAVPALTFLARDRECEVMSSSRAAQEFLRVGPGSNTSMSGPETDRPQGVRVFADNQELAPAELPMQVAARTGRRIGNSEYKFLFDDGSVRYIYGGAVPLFNDDGHTRGAVGAFVDITERKRSEDTLRESDERLRLAARAANFGTFHGDFRTGSLYWSPEFRSIVGISHDLPPSAPGLVPEFVHPDDRQKVKSAFESAFRGENGGAISVEHRIVLPDGLVRWVNVRGQAECEANVDGVVPATFSGMMLDVTDLKRIERELSESKQRLELAMKAGSSGSFDWDPTTNENIWSEELLALYGLRADQFGGRYEDWVETLVPEDRASGMRAVSDALSKGEYSLEFRIRRRDTGEIRWMDGRGRVVRDEHGKVQRLIGINVDITERKRVQEALVESERRFRELADSLPQLIWVTDANGDNLYCNRRFLDYSGLSPETMLGFTWRELIHPDDLDFTLTQWANCVATGTPYLNEYRLRRKDGEYRYFLARAVPVRNENGDIEQWMGSSTDIHEQKLSAEALRRSEKLAAAGRLAASIAHEINNPLAAVTNSIFLSLNDPTISHSVRNFLVMADQELARVTNIARQSLRFHKQSARAKYADLSEVFESVFSLYGARLQGLRINVAKEYRTTDRLYCYCDDLRQVFANLVGNSVDAMSNGGKLRIRVRTTHLWTSSERAGILVSVADDGHGIDRGILKNLFEPFVTSKDATNTGLGLWISDEIVRKHQGSIRVRTRTSADRHGTVFAIFLPFDGVEDSSKVKAGAANR